MFLHHIRIVVLPKHALHQEFEKALVVFAHRIRLWWKPEWRHERMLPRVATCHRPHEPYCLACNVVAERRADSRSDCV